MFCCQLSNHLIKMGHEVEVYSIYDGKASLPLKGKEVQTLARPRNMRFVDYKGWRHLAEIIEEFKPDIVQANAADTLKYAVLSKIFFKWEKPLVYRNASASSFYIKTKFSKRINQFLLKRVDAIVSVSKASRDDLNKLFPFTAPITHVIPVGVEKRIISEEADQTEGFGKRKKLLHIGSFTKEKNHSRLLEIFKQIKNEEPSAELHLVGEGILKEDIQQKVKDLNLKNSVFMHGEVEDPTSFLLSSDVLLLPSLIEGLPAVVLEAMNVKVPVVAYDTGGISEVLSNNTGYLIEKNNESSFASAVLQELKEPNIEKVENAYKLVSKDFLNKGITKQFLEIYKQTCS